MKKILIVTLTFVLSLLFYTTPTIYEEENSNFPFKSLSKAIIKDENDEILLNKYIKYHFIQVALYSMEYGVLFCYNLSNN